MQQPKLILRLLLFILGLNLSGLYAQSVSGTRGLIHSPTAELFPDKTFILGASYIPKPYFQRFNRRVNPGMPTYVNLTLLPFMEVMFRYTHELNMKVNPQTEYFPDRMMTFRFQLLKEKNKLPAFVLGLQDVTRLVNLSSSANNYAALYGVVTKSFNAKNWLLKTSLGYGLEIEEVRTLEDYRGVFGGIELAHQSLPDTSFMLEYNSYHPIVGINHLFFKRFHFMVGLWDLKKITGGINYRKIL